tara:strand:- start:417 stop:593 length:177 start_codon:yes stop_codon:yes gene_type:complete
MTQVSTLLDNLNDILSSPKLSPSRRTLLNDILIDYISRLDDDELEEIEDTIVNQFGVN